MTTTCHSNRCNAGTSAASASATVQAISDARVNEAVRKATCLIDGAAHSERTSVMVTDVFAGLSSTEEGKVADALRSRGFQVGAEYYSRGLVSWN